MRLFKFPVDVDIKKTKKIIPSIIYGLVYDDS